MNDHSNSDGLMEISLARIDGNEDGLQSYIHDVEVLPLASSIKHHYIKVQTKGLFEITSQTHIWA